MNQKTGRGGADPAGGGGLGRPNLRRARPSPRHSPAASLAARRRRRGDRAITGELAAKVEALNEATHYADIAEASRAELQARVKQLGALLDQEREAHAQTETEARQQAEKASGALAERDTAHAEIERLRTELRTQTEALTAAMHRADTAEAARAELQARVEQLTDLLGLPR